MAQAPRLLLLLITAMKDVVLDLPLQTDSKISPAEWQPRPRCLALALAVGILLYLLPLDLFLPIRPFALLAKQIFSGRYCRPEELGVGRWIPRPAEVTVDGHTWSRLKASVGYGFCDDANRTALACAARFPDGLRQLQELNRWEWKPQGCALRPLEPAALVKRLAQAGEGGQGRRGLLFVGGRSAQRQAQSLGCLLGQYVDRGSLSDTNRSGVFLAENAGKIDFVRNEYLANPVDWTLQLPEDADPIAANDTSSDRWTPLVRDREFIVINSGEELGPLTPARLARYTDTAKQVIDFIDSRSHATLIVRASIRPLPHACTVNASSTFDTSSMSSVETRKAADLDTLNTVWKDLLWNHPKHVFLDVSRMMASIPPPANTSCLRDCLPGPTDTWNSLLNHVILQSS